MKICLAVTAVVQYANGALVESQIEYTAGKKTFAIINDNVNADVFDADTTGFCVYCDADGTLGAGVAAGAFKVIPGTDANDSVTDKSLLVVLATQTASGEDSCSNGEHLAVARGSTADCANLVQNTFTKMGIARTTPNVMVENTFVLDPATEPNFFFQSGSAGLHTTGKKYAMFCSATNSLTALDVAANGFHATGGSATSAFVGGVTLTYTADSSANNAFYKLTVTTGIATAETGTSVCADGAYLYWMAGNTDSAVSVVKMGKLSTSPPVLTLATTSLNNKVTSISSVAVTSGANTITGMTVLLICSSTDVDQTAAMTSHKICKSTMSAVDNTANTMTINAFTSGGATTGQELNSASACGRASGNTCTSGNNLYGSVDAGQNWVKFRVLTSSAPTKNPTKNPTLSPSSIAPTVTSSAPTTTSVAPTQSDAKALGSVAAGVVGAAAAALL